MFNSDDIKLVKKDKDDAENRHEILLKNLDASYYTLDTPEDILRAIKLAESESLEAEINGLKNTITGLTDWKDSMMKVHNELDLQGIGTALELPLGSSIAPQVLPKVKELIEHNAELVGMLEDMETAWQSLPYGHNSVRDTQNWISNSIHPQILRMREWVSKHKTKHNHLNQM